MTREHRMKVAEAQEEKARYHMYGGKKGMMRQLNGRRKKKK